jgi:hypothetical protein
MKIAFVVRAYPSEEFLGVRFLNELDNALTLTRSDARKQANGTRGHEISSQ